MTARKRKDGSVAFIARVRVMRGGFAYHETETFDRRPAATSWIKKREHEIAKPWVIAEYKTADPPLARAIDRYTEESLKEIGRTKAQVLRAIKNYPIADMPCSTDLPPEKARRQRSSVRGRLKNPGKSSSPVVQRRGAARQYNTIRSGTDQLWFRPLGKMGFWTIPLASTWALAASP